MKKFIVAVSALALAGMASLSVAASNLKIGVVDIHKILQHSPEVAKINKRLESKFKPKQEKIAIAQKELNAEVKRLSRNSSILSQTQRDKLVAKVAQDRRSLLRMEQDFHDNLSLQQHQSLQKLFARIQSKIDTIAKKEHYDLILQKYGTPFASNSIDITDQVEKAIR